MKKKQAVMMCGALALAACGGEAELSTGSAIKEITAANIDALEDGELLALNVSEEAYRLRFDERPLAFDRISLEVEPGSEIGMVEWMDQVSNEGGIDLRNLPSQTFIIGGDRSESEDWISSTERALDGGIIGDDGNVYICQWVRVYGGVWIWYCWR